MVPKVSVIMSVFNEEKYLKYSIESILSQTYSDFEFIICDDASTDNSVNLVREYMKKDNRIKLLQNETNLGLAESLNRCIKIAKGEYIARMDADDICEVDRLERQIKFLESNHNVAVVCGGINLIDENNKIWGKRLLITPLTKENIFKYNPIAHPTVMMRKNAVLDVGGYTVSPFTRRGQDFDLWCKLCEKGYNFEKIHDVLLNYREYIGAYKKRGFKTRLDAFKLRRYWRRKLDLPLYYEIYAIKQLIAGIIPKTVMFAYHKIKFKKTI